MEKSVQDLIDPPSSAAPTKRWQDFMASFSPEDQKRPEVQALLKEGHAELQRRQRAKKPWWVEA